MAKLTKDAMELVLKNELRGAEKQPVANPAPKQESAPSPKGKLIGGELIHAAGKQGFRIVGCIHTSPDPKSPLMGYVLYNDKKQAVSQYSVDQVRSILDTYEFVNAVLEGDKIRITDCAQDKLLQFDNFMNPISIAVYVVARTTETITAGARSKEQTSYKIINKNLQVASILEDKLMIAVKQGATTVANLRVDEEYFAAKDVEALPTFTREVSFQKTPTEQPAAQPTKNSDPSKKFENHARFLDAMCAFLDSCVVIRDDIGSNPSYVAVGSTNNVKRGLAYIGKNPAKFEAIMRSEVLPLYVARKFKPSDKLKALDEFEKTGADASTTKVYSYTYNKAIELLNKTCPGMVPLLQKLAYTDILPVLEARDVLKMHRNSYTRDGKLNDGRYAIFKIFDHKRYGEHEAYAIDWNLNIEKSYLASIGISVSPRAMQKIFLRMPVCKIASLQDAGKLVGCGVLSFSIPDASEQGYFRAIIVWPRPKALSGPIKKVNEFMQANLMTESKKNPSSLVYTNVRPFVDHILTEYAYFKNLSTAGIDGEACNYTVHRITAMACLLLEYLVHEEYLDTSICTGLVSTILEPLSGYYALRGESIHGILDKVRYKNETHYLYRNVPTRTIADLFISTGGLVAPHKGIRQYVQAVPALLIRGYRWHLYGEVEDFTSIISTNAAYANQIQEELKTMRPKGTRQNRFCNCMGGRIRAYLEALGGQTLANYTVTRDGGTDRYTYYANAQNVFRAIAGTHLYILRPYYCTTDRRHLKPAIEFVRFTVPSRGWSHAGGNNIPAMHSTHKLW